MTIEEINLLKTFTSKREKAEIIKKVAGFSKNRGNSKKVAGNCKKNTEIAKKLWEF